MLVNLIRLAMTGFWLLVVAFPTFAETPYERIRAAIEGERTDDLATLLDSVADPDDLTGERTPLLVVAVARGNLQATELLLTHGADVDAKAPGMYGATGLMIAAGNNDFALVKRLLKAGARINARDANGDPPLNWVAYYGFEDMTKLLLAAGADQSLTGHGNALEIAMRRGHQGTVRILLEDAHRLRVLNETEHLLEVAIDNDDADAVFEAVHRGALATGTDQTHRPWIARAARTGKLKALNALLSSGANVDSRDQIGFTPLMEAAREGRKEVIEALLAKGANPKAKAGSNGLELTALHLAAIGGHADVIELLASKGVDLNAADRVGNTPMLWGLYEQQIETALLLHRLGADPTKANDQGDSPRAFAKQNQIDALIKAFGAR